MSDKISEVTILIDGGYNQFKCYSIKDGFIITRHFPQGQGDYHSITVEKEDFKHEYFRIERIIYANTGEQNEKLR